MVTDLNGVELDMVSTINSPSEASDWLGSVLLPDVYLLTTGSKNILWLVMVHILEHALKNKEWNQHQNKLWSFGVFFFIQVPIKLGIFVLFEPVLKLYLLVYKFWIKLNIRNLRSQVYKWVADITELHFLH